ncbi:MAG: hypothetical protein GVY36_02735 [Verrucomicrobia bacterium]|jgi:hypothetical protein|nr:hypothetical protein [Verrucomicrobiota bacterium]
MNEEKGPQGQVETALKQAAAQHESSEAERQRELLKLTGGLRRISFYVTDEEHDGLCVRSGAGTIETFLEAFVADLTESKRSIWEECRVEAQHWRRAHMRGEYAHRAVLQALGEPEGGEQ